MKTQRLNSVKLGLVLLFVFIGTTPAFSQSNLDLYGYFSTRYEKVFGEPSLENGAIVREDAPGEWSNPFLNVMLQHQLGDKFRVFVNLNGAGGEVAVRNFWGEYAIAPYFRVRIGRIYRKFGLYNELLDAVPTYYGIEPPELFDKDHLIVSRTSTVMVYGTFNAGPGQVEYSLATDNGEGGPMEGVIPVGWDLKYRKGFAYTLGFSGYTSGGETTSDVGVGSGSPRTGVLPWMAGDKFSVIGAYGEAILGSVTLQGAFWYSNHNAERDPASVLAVIEGADPNAAQLRRFLHNVDEPFTADNVNIDGDYSVKTWYLRAGYSFITEVGEVAPYVQWDWYNNPETVGSKKWGGDNEAGVADDGIFNKATLGVVFRPIPNVAVKLDGSSHIYKLGGDTVQYPELRFDVSYVFGQ
ncbi:MAG: hypothetical protein ACE5G0_11845 [Rhodothermales bacterium]